MMLLSVSLSAQYIYEWNDYYGGDAMDEVASLTKTFDNNIFIVGQAKDSVDAMWLVKISPAGEKLWSKLYTGYKLMRPTKIIETFDNNLVVTGIVSEGDSVPHKIWVAKITPFGDVLWEKLYKGRGDAYSTDLIQTFDHGLVISGYTADDVHDFPDWYVIKLDSIGNKIWDKSYGSPYDDRALSVAQLYDSSLIVVGYISYAYGGLKKASMTKFSNSGMDLWADDLKVTDWSTANSVAATSDSAFVIATEVKNSGLLDFDVRIVKMTSNGDIIWEKSIDREFMSHPVNIIETYDQGYAIAYTSKSDGVGNTNVAVMKLTPLGETAWEKEFQRNSDDYASQIIEDPNNALVIGASTYTLDKAWNFGIVKFKSLEMSDLKFITPLEPVLTFSEKKIPIDAIIIGYKEPLEVKIYVNTQLVDVIDKFEIKELTENQYVLKNEIPLVKGLNIIDFIVTDYKDFKFIKTRKVYYLPNPTPHW